MNLKYPNSRRNSKPTRLLVYAGLLSAFPAVMPAQDMQSSESSASADEEQVYMLAPFEVDTERDVGYQAASSLAGSRLNTDLRDIAAAVQVITPEFMKDVGATKLDDLLIYTTNTEVAGVRGNYFGGNAYDKGYARGMLMESQTTARIRGLNNADITRNFFPTDIPIDWYSLSRVDISRGPNSVLFGLGSPAGLINNTLKVPGLNKDTKTIEFRVGSYGSTRASVDIDQTIVDGTLGVRIAGLNDEARFQQEYTYNRDRRLYAAVRWQPKIAPSIFTQVDVQGEWGKIKGNRPVVTTAADFLTNWYGAADHLTIPNDEYWNAPGFVEDVYASQTLGGQLWDDHPVTFYGDARTGTIGLPDGGPQAQLMRGSHNVNGGGWGSWVGLLNPNATGNAAHEKNSAAYYANNPTVSSIISDYESQTGKTFSGFGSSMWPMQMIVDGPIAEMAREHNMVGPNKEEWNNFEVFNIDLTQSYWNGRVGLNFAYNHQAYRTGYTNLVEGLWGMNIISVDVNETLRGSTTPNPNYGRLYTIGEGRGGNFERNRENWRATGFLKLRADDFLSSDSWAARILGDHTFTFVRSHQHYENLNLYYALYRWEPEYISALTNGDNQKTYATWRGIHYLSGSVLNTNSMNDITGVTGISSNHTPAMTQSVWYDNQGVWTQGDFNLISSKDNIDKLYDGANQGYDNTDSLAFVWQGKMLDGVLVPIFGWRQDKYSRWDKPSNLSRDSVYNYVLPFSKDWNYDSVTPLSSNEERRSWSIAMHGKELMRMLGGKLPWGMDITLMYNDSSTFRPSDTAASVYNEQEATPSGETQDVSLLVSAFNDKVSLRITKYRTIQHNTSFSGAAPAFNSNKATLARSMDGMMWEIGDWAGADPTERVQPTPEWLINKWMFGDNYDKSVANTPLPANWRDDPSIMSQPLRIRASAVEGSSTYVSQGSINPDTDLPYVAPPLTADEVAYRTEWFKSRTDAEWSRPVDQKFWSAMNFTRDYTAAWGGYWEPDGWVIPQSLKNLNDLESKGVEYELTANPTPNWRISFNASKAEAVRSNVLNSWKDYIEQNSAFWFDGGYSPNDTPAADYWSYKGFYDIVQAPNATNLGTAGRFGTEYTTSVYNPYYLALATENQKVNELRKWHFNMVTNYTFSEGFLRGLGVGAAVRWEDRSNIGYYPKYNAQASAWVNDLDNPIKGPREQNYDAWVSYTRKINDDVEWSIQVNAYNLFANEDLIPVLANPDGTIAQVRLPAETTWSINNVFRF